MTVSDWTDTQKRADAKDFEARRGRQERRRASHHARWALTDEHSEWLAADAERSAEVRDEPDDSVPRAVRSNTDPAAEGVLARPELFREARVDDHDQLAIAVVSPFDRAASENRDAESGEETG